jgi:hypothetical protein
VGNFIVEWTIVLVACAGKVCVRVCVCVRAQVRV